MARVVAKRDGNHQSDRDKEGEERNASPGDKTRGAEHKHYARVADLPLVLQHVAFDKEKSES